MEIEKKRIECIDVAKGILILCLLYGHMWVLASMDGHLDVIIDNGFKTMVIYNSFFMQTFFLITGFCSTFNVEIKTFLWKNIKTLIIPSIILCAFSYLVSGAILGFEKDILVFLCSYSKWLTTEGPWFIIALFWTKILYWLVNKLSWGGQLCVITLLYMVGLFFNKHGVYNIQWHQHAFMMLPYMHIGYYARQKYDVIQPYIKYIAIIGGLNILIQSCSHIFYNTFIPTHDLYINVSYKTIPLHFVNVISGTAFTLWVSKKINKCQILQIFGKGTLVVYLLNGMVHVPLLRLFTNFYSQDNWWQCVLFYSLSYFSTIIVFYYLINIIYNNPYLKWIVGKW